MATVLAGKMHILFESIKIKLHFAHSIQRDIHGILGSTLPTAKLSVEVAFKQPS